MFFFHGTPGSRLGAQIADGAAAQIGVRLIAVDRPGCGLSDFKPGRTILEWPDDVVQLAEALRIDRFAVVGVSGGGPYVAACAIKIPQRLRAAAMVSSGAPLDAPGVIDGFKIQMRPLVALGRRFPWLGRLPMWLQGRALRRNPDRFLLRTIASLPEPDRAVLSRPERRAVVIESLREAFRSGNRGAAWEVELFVRPWGFRLEDIPIEVHLWHGEMDTTAPPAMGRYLARTIPNCRATLCPNEGHLLFDNHMEEILGAVVAQEASASRA